MDKKRRNLIIIIVVLLIAVAAIVVSIIFNTRDKKIPANPPGTIGNLAGNLNNSGLFCESNGKVFFANSFDNDTIYVMNVDESDIKSFSNVRACNLLAGGDYLYYFQLGVSGTTGLGGIRTPHSFNRVRMDGKNATSVIRRVVVTGQLVDDTLFLLATSDAGPELIKIGTDGKDETSVASYIINPACASNGYLYYNGTVADHNLYRMDAKSTTSVTLLDENVWYPCIQGDYIYYMDPGNDYQLRRYSLSSGSVEILTKKEVQAFNVGYGYIYYQTMGDEPGLYCMNYDGSNSFLLASGNFSDINITSRYVYFKNFFEPEITYHSFLGTGSYDTFLGASRAVLSN